MPSLSELTDYEVPVPEPAPASIPRVYIDTSEKKPEKGLVQSITDKLLGLNGEERYQLWPEKVVREGLSAAGDVMANGTIAPGLRREDFTDIPAPDMPTKDSTALGKFLNVAPVAASPQDKLIEQAGAISALAGTGGLAGAEEGAVLNATPSLRPALKYKDKLYKGKPGQEHQDVIPQHLYPEFQQMAMSGEDISHYNFGFVNDKGHFLDRESALKYGIDNGLIDPQAGKFGALTSTLMADSSKPGTAIEAMGKTGNLPTKEFLKNLEVHDATLPPDAQDAISRFVGGPHDTINKGIEGGIMDQSLLEHAYGGDYRFATPPANSALVKEQLEQAVAPIREALRKEYGDNLTLYRTQGDLPKDAGTRQTLSMSADNDFVNHWAGVKKVRDLYTEEEIKSVRKKLDETGEAEAGNYILKKSEHSPKYYDLHSKKGEYLTDSGGPEELLKGENEWLSSQHANNNSKLKNVHKYDVPVDNVLWYTNRFGQKEFIVKNDENLKATKSFQFKPVNHIPEFKK